MTETESSRAETASWKRQRRRNLLKKKAVKWNYTCIFSSVGATLSAISMTANDLDQGNMSENYLFLGNLRKRRFGACFFVVKGRQDSVKQDCVCVYVCVCLFLMPFQSAGSRSAITVVTSAETLLSLTGLSPMELIGE